MRVLEKKIIIHILYGVVSRAEWLSVKSPWIM
nr:MAG TPA: hypothetical protein [Caudoviricetes sp.]